MPHPEMSKSILIFVFEENIQSQEQVPQKLQMKMQVSVNIAGLSLR